MNGKMRLILIYAPPPPKKKNIYSKNNFSGTENDDNNGHTSSYAKIGVQTKFVNNIVRPNYSLS